MAAIVSVAMQNSSNQKAILKKSCVKKRRYAEKTDRATPPAHRKNRKTRPFRFAEENGRATPPVCRNRKKRRFRAIRREIWGVIFAPKAAFSEGALQNEILQRALL
jgi:hypothetical protein